MSFGHPLLLLTLLVLPLAVGVYWLAERRRMRYAVAFTNLEVLASVAEGRAWRRWVPPILFLAALAALCAAVARPHHNTMVATDRATVILVIDASGSMEAEDVKPTRLGAAQAAVRTFLDRVPEKLKVGLVVFAGEAQVATPPTEDHDLVRTALDEIGRFPGFGGTAIGDALAQAVEVAKESTPITARPPGQTIAYTPVAAETQGPVSILMLSDGKQTRGLLEPLEGAARARELHIPVFTISLGTPEGVVERSWGGIQRTIPVPPDPQTLSAIARTTGGRFFAARSAESLRSAYEKLGSSLGREPGKTEITYVFLAVAAGLLVAAGVLSALWSPRFP